ncbi:MAG TPA: hypothetical protein PLK90_00975 [Clostridiales bacterium]|nr:hypothetical protein [Clostridiales bacterium]HQP68949.1 hypothetical protein [Clostridiales bacterium]
MNYKNILAIILTVFIISSCDEENVSPYKDDHSVVLDKKLSVIPGRIQFSKNKVYHFKIAADTDYMVEDGFSTKAFFTLGDHDIEMQLYDDGISDDSLQNDLAASNNIWSGGINSADFPVEGVWELKIDFVLNDSTVIGSDSFTGIKVARNTAPVITAISGVTEGDSLKSGFKTFPVTVSINDPDNDITGFNDNQKLELKITGRPDVKYYYYDRKDPLGDIVINTDSVYASGLSTGRYSFAFTAEDLYGEKDTLIVNGITIENSSPVISSVQHPDTVFVPSDSTLFVDFGVTVKVNDPQGSYEFQDIDNVAITTGSPRYMRDNGEDLDQTANDAVYTIAYSVSSSFFTGETAVLPYSIQAVDKAENTSNILSGQLIFKKYDVKKSKWREDAAATYHANPFN